MNKNQFISLLENPENLSTESVSMLDGIIKEFPYFQTAHLLYAKNLHNQNSIHYSSQLKLAAAYVTDRSVLYQLINQERQPFLAEKPEIISERPVVEVPTVIEKKEDVKEQIAEVVPPVVPVQTIVEVITRVVPIEAQVEDRTLQVDAKKVSALEKDIINKAIEATINKEVSELIEEDEEEEKVADLEDVQKQDMSELNTTSTHSFSDWLKLANPDAEKEEKKKINYADLIDKFIVQQPKISRPNMAFFSPVDKARQSAIDNDTVVTATLAEVYVKQANYSKAIKAYESLRLKYPEKSLYFAARIKEIEKLINY